MFIERLTKEQIINFLHIKKEYKRAMIFKY